MKKLHSLRSSVCILASALLIGGCAAIPKDEPLDEGAAAFYAPSRDAVDPNNGAIGLIGLSAPSGQDFMAYGRMLAAQPIVFTFAEVPKQSEVSNALPIKWNEERMNCWQDDYEPFDQDPKCAPIEEAIQTLRDNAELLQRYRLILKLPAASGFIQARGVRSIAMTKLTAVAIKVDLRQGRVEEAYRIWVDQYSFWRRMNSVSRTWVEVAIGLVNEGYALRGIESLLFRSPQLIDTHYDELLSLLSPDGVVRFNFPGIMRAEYALIMQAYEVDKNRAAIFPNYITNRHYRYAQQMLEVVSTPADLLNVLGTNRKNFLKPIELNATDPRFAASAEFVGPGVYLGPFELIKSMHNKNQLMALLSMRIRIFKEKVPESQIAAYLVAHAANMRESFTDRPMQWDRNKRVLFFDSENRSANEVRL